MSIQYVGGQKEEITAVSPATQTVTFSLTGGTASTPAAGDLVLVLYTASSTTDDNLSSKMLTAGYTQVSELYSNGTAYDANMAVFRKFMGASPDASLDIVGKNFATSGGIVQIAVFSGVDTTTPLDVTPTTVTGTGTGNTNPTAITPATSGNIIVALGNAAILSSRSYTTATTAYMSGFLQSNRLGTVASSLSGIGYIPGQPNGVSYNPATWLISSDSTNYSWASVTIALRAYVSSPITGTASGTFDVTGASTGTMLISGASSDGMAISGAAIASVLATASASSTFDVTGASTGAAIIAAASSGDMAISGAAIASVLAAASASGTIYLSGSASGGGAKMLVAAGSIGIAGSATSTVRLSAIASGQIYLTGSAQGGVAIVAASSGQIGITGAADGEVSYNTGEASGALAFTGAAIGAIYVRGSVSGAISFSLASYGKHLWLQQSATDETWSVQAANSEIWQPVSGSGTAWE